MVQFLNQSDRIGIEMGPRQSLQHECPSTYDILSILSLNPLLLICV